MDIVHEIEIGRPRDAVFSFLADHTNHARFIVENIATRHLGEGPVGIGSRVQNDVRVMGTNTTETFEITDFDPPRLLGKKSAEGAAFASSDRFDLETVPGGTRVRLTVSGHPKHAGQKIALFFLRPVMRRSIKKALGRLKSLLESEA